MTKQEIVSAFINRINARDVDGISTLMDENHTFIDGLGHSIKGREAMRRAWQSYFAIIPDYWIKVDRMLEDEGAVAIFGRAGGTVAHDAALEPGNRWGIPAAWLAVVNSNSIAVWQVFADTEPVRRIIARTAPKKAST
jgi:hypothetical protein